MNCCENTANLPNATSRLSNRVTRLSNGQACDDFDNGGTFEKGVYYSLQGLAIPCGNLDIFQKSVPLLGCGGRLGMAKDGCLELNAGVTLRSIDQDLEWTVKRCICNGMPHYAFGDIQPSSQNEQHAITDLVCARVCTSFFLPLQVTVGSQAWASP